MIVAYQPVLMMARAKRIYILMVEVNKFIFFFASRYFLKEIENMFFVFLSVLSCFHSISRSPKLSLVFLLNN